MNQKRNISYKIPILSLARLFLAIVLLNLVSTVYASLSDGLVAHYPFNGNANDETVNGNHGVVVGGATLTEDRFSNSASAYDFDGIDDYIEVQSTDSLNISGDFSVALWVLVDRYDYGSVLISKGWGDSGPFYLQFHSNTNLLTGRLITDTEDIKLYTGVQRPLDGQWHHYAMTFTSGQQRVYFDGELKVSGSGVGTLVTNDYPMRIGHMTNRTYILDAKVDDVRIYNRAIALEEVNLLYLGAIDNDGDGFYSQINDCNDSNPSINPGAYELPGNLVDENCDGDLGNCNPCENWKNHGQYVRCIAHAVQDLVQAGAITEDDGDILVNSGARSDIGKNDHIPSECQ